jgi:protein phosphatase methylesterase 1
MDNMSDLQKEFVRSRLAKLPREAPPIFDEAEEDASNAAARASSHHDDDSSSASSASSTGTIVPSSSKNLFARPTGYAIPRAVSLNRTLLDTGSCIDTAEAGLSKTT